MSGNFSDVVRLANLDDFITPSQQCIKPVEIKKEPSGTGSKIKIDDDGSYYNVNSAGEKSKLGRVDISLADCLACSGCITTAETVLITQQSHEEMMKMFKNKDELGIKQIVVSIQIQPILSLAAAYKLTPNDCLQKLTGLLKRLGADMVLDMGLAEDLALVEEQKEFINRYERYSNGDKTALPMLASTCPGWVCYAEKTKSHLLPHLSTCRSPQQIMGRLVKGFLSKSLGIKLSEIYHVTIMPCYDKKLEASRQQFQTSDVRDVDCVVTPVEVATLFNDENIMLNLESNMEPDWPWQNVLPYRYLTRPQGSSSGGYAYHVAEFTCSHFNLNQPLDFRQPNARRSDVETVEITNGETTLKIAVVTGFKNIQNMVNKIKRGNCDFSYVEVMACPSGCLNGGAQIKSQYKEVESLYRDLEQRKIGELHDLYEKSFIGVNSEGCNEQLHTTFEAVTYNPNPLSIKW